MFWTLHVWLNLWGIRYETSLTEQPVLLVQIYWENKLMVQNSIDQRKDMLSGLMLVCLFWDTSHRKWFHHFCALSKQEHTFALQHSIAYEVYPLGSRSQGIKANVNNPPGTKSVFNFIAIFPLPLLRYFSPNLPTSQLCHAASVFITCQYMVLLV